MVLSEGKYIRHGIVRDFPTRYCTWSGLRAEVPFHVVSAFCDGMEIPYRIVSFMNGVRIYLGDEHTVISRGLHSYVVTYQVYRVLSFQTAYDELVWNVTGNDSLFDIEQVAATVYLPDAVPTEKVNCCGYTGFYGQTGTAYSCRATAAKGHTFKTTNVLSPGEGFTLDIAWPKGYVLPMSKLGLLFYIIRDNLDLCILVLSFILLIFVYAAVLQRAWRNMPPTTVIPLYYPPRDFMPGALRYVVKRHFDSTCTAAEIVRMAVLGYLTISYKKNLLAGGTYTLVKKEVDGNNVLSEYRDLFNILFAKQDRIVLGEPKSAFIIDALMNQLKLVYAKICASPFLQSRFVYIWPALLISFGALAIALLCNFYAFLSLLNWIVISLHVIVHVVSITLLPAYTYEGQKIKNEIDGFKLFLMTTEKERIKLVGTPPERTPELFEHYLPYAIALAVEKKWATQFASIFKSLEDKGNPYIPIWIMGTSRSPWKLCMERRFAHAVSAHLVAAGIGQKNISSSGKWPGSSSGFGKGSSGSGSGGGGFGGW